MKKISQLLRYISIKQRLLIGFILVPVLTLSVYFITYDVITKQVILEKSAQTSEELLSIVVENFNLNVNKFEQQLDEIMANEMIHQCIDDATSTNYSQKRELYTNLNTFINTKTHFLSNAYELAVYTREEELTYSKGTNTFPADIIARYAQEASAVDGRSIWFHTTLGKDSVVGLARAIIDREEECKGYVFLALNESAFTSLFASEQTNGSSILVVDAQNRFLFGQQSFLEGSVVFSDGEDTLTIGSQHYQLSVLPIQDAPWKLVYLSSVSYALKELNSLRTAIMFYVCIIIFLLILIMTLIYKSLYEPLHRLLQSMNAIHELQLDVQVEDKGSDELHEVVENYNGLLVRIQDLVQRLEKEQEEKRNAEIKMLQAQINPHFLFNTLNTLRYLAILNNDKPLSQGIYALAKLLRNTITDSKELVDIEAEIENVENYIIIQKLRYGDLFETEIDVAKEIRHDKIMKFLLQPIVENAILHGFEEDREDQLLKIHIRLEEQGILVEIIDNGKGYDEETQQEAQSNKKLSGIGMKNIEERIHLTYGDAYSMESFSEVGKGTIVRLHLPRIKEEGTPCIE